MQTATDAYISLLQTELPPPGTNNDTFRPIALDLFAGCGGLALGFEAAGFKTIGFEANPEACETYNRNLIGECKKTFLRPGVELVEDDSVIDIVIGGPPCQPFSVIGSQQGRRDDRNGFPAFIDTVSRYQPKLAIFENVRGMLYRNKPYFNQIRAELRALGYAISWRLLNASDFGVPQKRERLFVVAHRTEWDFPTSSYSKNAFTAGDALFELPPDSNPTERFLTNSMDRYISAYEAKSKCINPRDLHMDRPSRTVTCRNLYGATADMLRIKLADGRRRMLSEREAARIQSFPDWFSFSGSESNRFEQIGNAVPPLLAKAVAEAAMKSLHAETLMSPRLQELNELDEQLELYV